MKSYVDLGNKYISRKRLRAFLVIMSMVLATILIYVSVTAGLGTYMHARQQEERLQNYYVYYNGLSEEQYETLQQYANVESAIRGGYVEERLAKAEGARFCAQMPQYFYEWYFFQLLELESFEQDIFCCDVVEGRLPENDSEIILSSLAIHRFTKEVQLGDKITINSRLEYGDEAQNKTVTKEYTLCGIYQGEEDSIWNDNVGYTLAQDTEGLSAFVRFKRKYHWKKDATKLADAMQATPDQEGQRYHFNVALAPYYLQNEMIVAIVACVLMVLLLIIYFCMVMIRSLMSTNVINKLRDYTILKSMGATNKQLRRIMMRESLLQGGIAYVLGVVAGQLLLSLVLVKHFEVYGLSFQYVWVSLIVTALFMWATIELAAIEPFFLLKKVSIVEALGQSELIKKPKKKRKEGLFYKRLSIEGQYAYKNMKRNKKQFWNAVASFTISVLIITTMLASLEVIGVSVYGTLSSFVFSEKSPYDINVEIAYDEDGKTDFENIKLAMEALRARPDVTEAAYKAGAIVPQDQANGLHYRMEAKQYLYDSFSGDDLIQLMFLSKTQLERLNDYMVDGVDAYEAVKDGGVIVQGYGDTADVNDVQFYDLEVGDRISFGSLKTMSELVKEEDSRQYIATYKTIKERKAYDQYVVKGFCKVNQMIGDFPNTVIMSYDYVCDTYGEDFIKNFIDAICVATDHRAFKETSFNDFVGLQPALLSWNYTDPQKAVMQEMKVGILVGAFIVVFVLVMGVLNMLNSMVNEQLQRKKENAILRAIGMSRRALNKMLILEKMLVGFLSWFIGTALSVLLTFLYTIVFLYLEETKFVFPWYICGITAAVMFVIMAGLSWIMIVMVGKMDITEGIRNEG